MNYQTIRNGLPATAVETLIRNGALSEAEVYSVIPERTFKRRLQQRAKLKLEKADAIERDWCASPKRLSASSAIAPLRGSG